MIVFFKRLLAVGVVGFIVLIVIESLIVAMWARQPRKNKKMLVLPQPLKTMSIQEYLASEDRSKEGWRPLSEKEMQQKKEATVSKALKYGIELAEELEAPYLAEGLLWTEETLSSYRDFTEQYHLHLKLSAEEAIVRYEIDY